MYVCLFLNKNYVWVHPYTLYLHFKAYVVHDLEDKLGSWQRSSLNSYFGGVKAYRRWIGGRWIARPAGVCGDPVVSVHVQLAQMPLKMNHRILIPTWLRRDLVWLICLGQGFL